MIFFDNIHVSESFFLMGCENPFKTRQLIDISPTVVGGQQNIQNMRTI